ncbi:MAG: DNA polymerase I, partial [Candidatus Omnitrophica bacterium]|nr:DNA polymerase I [Candidatus Omnitrophota bacterium]
TNSEVLEILAPLYPIAREILDRRELYKMKSTFVDGLIELINPETRGLHTTFNQTVTATGRLSSSNPNLQNIPIRSKLGKDLREAFEAQQGKLLMSSDYSQIELRILAHLSDDAVMKEAFKRNEDIHTSTARRVFNLKEEDEVASEMRRQAKIINFGIIYGMSAYGLGKQLGITPEDAQNYIDQYMERFQSVKRYIEFLVKEARKNGFARTMLGRRRPLAGKDIERLAINTPIQGTAADIIKLAMVEISEEFRKQKLKAVMILQVHDELLFEVPKKELEKTKKIVKCIMENVFPLSVPLKVNISWGKTWADID